jgi:hypothetical protein
MPKKNATPPLSRSTRVSEIDRHFDQVFHSITLGPLRIFSLEAVPNKMTVNDIDNPVVVQARLAYNFVCSNQSRSLRSLSAPVYCLIAGAPPLRLRSLYPSHGRRRSLLML